MYFVNHIRNGSPVTYWLKSLVVIGLLLMAQWSMAGVVVAGQELGKSKWSDRLLMKPAQYVIDDDFASSYSMGHALRAKGPIVGKMHGTVELFYDKSDVLIAAKIVSDDSETLLKLVAKQSKAKRQGNGSFIFKDLILREEKVSGRSVVTIGPASFTTDTPQEINASVTLGNNIVIWTSLLISVLSITSLLRKRNPKAKQPSKEFVVDQVSSFLAVVALLIFFPVFRLGLGNFLPSSALYTGYWLVLVWVVRSVRVSGWMPKDPVLSHILATVVSPVLLIPVIVRNSIKSAHYAGLVMFFAQISGLLYYYLRPSMKLSLVLIALLGIFGGGLVRVYCATFDHFNKRRRNPILVILYTLIAWPITVAVGVFIFLSSILVGLVGYFKLLLVPAVIVFVIGVLLGWDWLKVLAIVIPFLGGLEGLIALLVTGVAPTGYSGLNFNTEGASFASDLPMMSGEGFGSMGGGIDDFAFNSANGMPMIGGIGGVDIYGNSFGTNWNDPH